MMGLNCDPMCGTCLSVSPTALIRSACSLHWNTALMPAGGSELYLTAPPCASLPPVSSTAAAVVSVSLLLAPYEDDSTAIISQASNSSCRDL